MYVTKKARYSLSFLCSLPSSKWAGGGGLVPRCCLHCCGPLAPREVLQLAQEVATHCPWRAQCTHPAMTPSHKFFMLAPSKQKILEVSPQPSQSYSYFFLCKCVVRVQFRMQFSMSICYCRVLRKQKLRPAIDCSDSCSHDNRPRPHCIIRAMPVFDRWVFYWNTGKVNIK